MGPIRVILCAAAVSAFATTPDLELLLKGVENRYNRAETLKVLFHEVYTAPQQPRRTESGTLYLRKPGRMRWEYTFPLGKLFVSDGKNLYLYTPHNNRVEKMKMKESEDMRVPLAFLLGKLNFSKEFRDIETRVDAAGTWITAKPKSDNLPYTLVEFLVSSNQEIRRVKVTGYDKSLVDFEFSGESMNPALEGKLFRFQAPKGAELVEGSQ